MSSAYYDTTAALQVVGDVFLRPQLLDEYTVTDEDLVEPLHRVIFGAIYKIHESGVDIISIENISDYLAGKPKSNAVFETNKGAEWLKNVSERVDPDSFKFYYDRLKKMTLLRAYDRCGIDVRSIYDPNLLDARKMQIQDEQLDSLTLIDIATKVDDEVEKVKEQYLTESTGIESQAGDGIDDLIEQLQQYPEAGVPLYGKYVNTVTRGARLGKLYLRSGGTGLGKAIPNNTLIPTPEGMRKVGDIKVGDYLFGQDGKPTKVLAVYPQPEDKEIWKVTFEDGRVAECCKDHLWEYSFKSHRKIGWRVESLEQLYKRIQQLRGGLRTSDNKSYRFSIKLNEPVQYPKREYSVHPYIMGAILGDGSFRYNNNNKSLTFSAESDELPNKIALLLGEGWHAHKNSQFNYGYTFKKTDNPKHNLWVEEILADWPDLWNKKSEDKYIPEEYLYGSIEQRWELLKGLMDTDGSIDKIKGRTNFTTISKKMCDQVIKLCRSLGMVATYTIDKHPDKYVSNNGECYNIRIQCKKELKPQMFSLERKVQIAINYVNNGKESQYKETLPIVNIEKTDKKVPMTCFTVDNDSHLFLMNDYIVTHNTRTFIADVCNIGCNLIWDDNLGWIGNGASEPCLFIATEQDLSEVQTMMLAFVSHVNEEHILNGIYEEGELDRVKKAAQVIKNSPIYVEEIPDFSMQDIENIVRKNIREHNVKYIFYDYLHSSLKILSEVANQTKGIKLREDNVLFMLSAHLKEICVENGVFIETGTQLSGDYKEADMPDQSYLRGARAIADKVDTASLILPVTPKDIDSLDILLQRGMPKPDIKISVYKNRRGRYKGIYLWCKNDLGTCRIDPQFVTTWDYQLIDMPDTKINIEESAF